MEILTSISEIISNHLFDAAGRQIGYLLNYNENIEALQKHAQELKATRDSMQLRICTAERNRDIILPDVKNWISKVDHVYAEAEKFLEDEGNVNKMCFKGWCINIRLRYRFNKMAKQTMAVITQLQKDGKFQTLSQPAAPSDIISPTMRSSGIFKSRELIKNDIMEALKDDKVSIIGICGMWGVGKSTQVKQVGKQAKEEKLYDSIVTVVVSQVPDVMKIQAEIAEMLGMTSFLVHSKSARANSLWGSIKNVKLLTAVTKL